MSDIEGASAGRGKPGPLTGITAVRVDVRVQQYEIEPCNWASHLRDANPPAAVAMVGTLGDFDDDPVTGQGKTVYAVRRCDPDAVVQREIGVQLEDALRGNFIAVSPTAPATFRLTAQTFHEAGRSHRVVLIRVECFQWVRLPGAPAQEVPALLWEMEAPSWDPVNERCWPLLCVVSALSVFLQMLHRQKPFQWYADLAARYPSGLPASVDGGTGQDQPENAP